MCGLTNHSLATTQYLVYLITRGLPINTQSVTVSVVDSLKLPLTLSSQLPFVFALVQSSNRARFSWASNLAQFGCSVHNSSVLAN